MTVYASVRYKLVPEHKGKEKETMSGGRYPPTFMLHQRTSLLR